jgi:hypothetical protein
MASKLRAIQPKEIKKSKAKILIFGESGVGKTYAALDFPNPYYFDIEEGATQEAYAQKLKKSGGAYVGPNQGAQDFVEILEQVKALATEKHGFKTVIFDSITKIFNLEITREHERIIQSGKKDEFGSSKKPAVKYMTRLVSWLQRMDMNCIMVAHSKAEWGKTASGEREEIGKTYDSWEKLIYELDLVLEIFKQGPKRMARVKKSRLAGFEDSDVFEWSYASFAKRYGEEAIESNVAQVELPTNEDLTQFYGLMAQKKTSEETKEKWLNGAKVETFEEMDAEKIRSIIKHLNGEK